MKRFGKISALVLTMMMVLSMGALAAATKTVKVTFDDVVKVAPDSGFHYFNVSLTTQDGVQLQSDHLINFNGAGGFYGHWGEAQNISFTAPAGWKLLSIQAWYEGELFGKCTDGTISLIYDADEIPCLLWKASSASGVDSVTLSDSADPPNGSCIWTPITITLVSDVPPATGDDTNVPMLIALMLLAAAGFVLSVRRSRVYR